MDNLPVEEELEECEELPSADDTEQLMSENIRRKREGKLDDVAAIQGALCIISAIGLVILNIAYPDIAEALFGFIKKFSSSADELFPNPIDTISEFIKNL